MRKSFIVIFFIILGLSICLMANDCGYCHGEKTVIRIKGTGTIFTSIRGFYNAA